MVDGPNTNVIRKITRGLRDDITDELRSLRQSQQLPFYYRAVVQEVIFDPLKLLEDDKKLLRNFVSDPYLIDTIPRNSIIAKRICTQGETNYNPELFFPFFPSHISFPIKPGEAVWIFYESHTDLHEGGYWISRIHERRDVEDVNYTHSDRRFLPPPSKIVKAGEKIGAKKPNNNVEMFGFNNGLNDPETFSLLQTGKKNAYDEIIETSIASVYHQSEPVPRYTSRPGDFTIQGSNNTLINLGTHRLSAVSDIPHNENNSGDGFGAIDIVVGRGATSSTAPKSVLNTRNTQETDKTIGANENPNEGDPDFENDRARIYIGMKMNVDNDFAIIVPEGEPSVRLTNTAGSPVNSSDVDRSAIVVKADQIRLLARNDIKIQIANPDDSNNSATVVLAKNGDIIFIPGPTGVIKLGGADADKAILVTDAPGATDKGLVAGSPLITTMGGLVGTGAAGQGMFATRVLIK